jgi:hypothetical protein
MNRPPASRLRANGSHTNRAHPNRATPEPGTHERGNRLPRAPARHLDDTRCPWCSSSAWGGWRCGRRVRGCSSSPVRRSASWPAALPDPGPVLNLELDTTVPARAVVGRPVTQSWRSRTAGPRPLRRCCCCTSLTAFRPCVCTSRSSPPRRRHGGGGAHAGLPRERREHAGACLPRWPVRVFVRSTHHPVPARPVVVHPQTVEVVLPGPRTAADDDPPGTGGTRAGVDVYGVREWRPGDVARATCTGGRPRARGRLAVVERERRSGRRSPSCSSVRPALRRGSQRRGRRVGSSARGRAGPPRRAVASQSALAPLVTGGPATLLDWSAALVEAPLPTAGRAGRGALVARPRR